MNKLSPQQKKYHTRWKTKARKLIASQAKGKFLDRRERKLTQRFAQWQASQRDLIILDYLEEAESQANLASLSAVSI